MDKRRPMGAPRFAAAAACLAVALALAPQCAPPAHAAEGDEVLGRAPEELGLADGDLPAIDAAHAAIVDDEGRVWFGRAAHEPAQIASLTKIMTAAVAVERLSADDAVTVTPTAAAVGESSAGLLAGDELRFDDALKALLTASGNDAAEAIAEAAGAAILAEDGRPFEPDAASEAFVGAMNAKAAEWGLEATVFTNPHGLDFDQWAQGQASCALDVAEMLRRAMQSDLVRANIGFSQVAIEVVRNGAAVEVQLSNTDELLGSYEGACAAKTGYTLAAGPCAANATNRDGREYYVAVLASSSKPQRFADSAALYDWVLAHRGQLELAAQPPEEEPPAPEEEAQPERETYQLVNAPRTVRAVIDGKEDAYPVVAEVAHADWTRRAFAATVADAGRSVEADPGQGRIQQEATFSEVRGDVRCGDVVGRLTFRQDGRVLWEADLVAAEDVAAPAWWEAVAVGVERFFGGLLGEPAAAESKLVAMGPLKVS